MSIAKTKDQSHSAATVTLSDILALSSGVGLLCAVRQFDALATGWSPVGRIALCLVAVVLIASGIRHSLVVLNPLRRIRNLRRLNRLRVKLPREGIAYLGIMSVLLVGALLGHSNMLMLVFAMMAGPFILNGWITYSLLKRNRVRRIVPRRAMAGELISVEIEVENRKAFLSTWLATVHDRIVRGRQQLEGTVLFTRIPPANMRRGYYQMRLYERGEYRLGPIRLATRFPLGLVERSQSFESTQEILIHPRVGRLTSRWKKEHRLASELTQRPRAHKGAFDDDFHRIREYFPGDNPSAVHWRTSARRNEIMVREYHQSRDQHMAVFLDLWQPVHPAGVHRDQVEYAISFAATVCVEHLKQSREARLWLWVSGRDVTCWEAKRGTSTIDSVLDMLALVQAGPSERLGQMFYEGLPTLPPNVRTLVITTRRDALSEVEQESRLDALGIVSDLESQLQVVVADPQHLEPFFVVPIG